jgi:transposase
MEIEKPKKPRIPIEIRWRIVGYIEAGKSLHEAASYFNHSYSSIQNIWKKFQELGAVSSKRRPGRPTEITEEKKIEIGSHLSEPYSSLKEVSIAHEISKTATFNIAHEFGLYYKYFAEKEEITETTALKRLNYAGQ